MSVEKWTSECGTVTLYCGDCLEILPTLAPGSVDAVVTDPPYGVNWDVGAKRIRSRGKYGVRIERNEAYCPIIGDSNKFDPTPILLMRVATVLFGGNHYSDKLPQTGAWWVWDKRLGVASTDQSDCELCWTNIGNRARMIRYQYHGGLAIAKENSIRVGGGCPVGLHPTQKPVAVMSQIIEWIPGKFVTVCDPYMGSGTTGVACVRLGRRFIGIELEPKYYAIAKRRIQDELKKVEFLEPKKHSESRQQSFLTFEST